MKYNKIYPAFKHWIEKGNLYFYSDPHFDDEEMEQLRNPYLSSEEQVKRINKYVGKNDTLVILGDVGNKEWLKKLRGYKVLVLGNHDAGKRKYEGYVDEVYEGAVMISENIILSHEPLDFHYAVNIHGHVHEKLDANIFGHILVSPENTNYTPISLSQIIDSGRLKEYTDIHEETVDNAIERKLKRKTSLA